MSHWRTGDCRPKPACGFTLIEALVAIAILGVVAVLAWRATDVMTGSEAAVSAESRRWQDLDALLARMEADMREALPRPMLVSGSFARSPGMVGSNATTGIAAGWSATVDPQGDTVIAFARAGPDALDAPDAGGQRVGYRMRDGELEVLYWPHLDDTRGDDAAIYPLSSGIRRFRVLQLTRDGRWSSSWPLAGENAIPRGARIEITLDDGSLVERTLALR